MVRRTRLGVFPNDRGDAEKWKGYRWLPVLDKLLGKLKFWKGKQPTPADADISTLQRQLQQEVLSLNLQANEDRIREIFGNSADLVIRHVRVGVNPEIEALIVHLDGMVDKSLLSESVVKPVTMGYAMPEGKLPSDQEVYRSIKEQLIAVTDVREVTPMEKVVGHIAKGDCIVIIQGIPRSLVCSTRGWSERSIEEPTSEAAVRGPREGFIENLRVNTSLLRRMIADPHLWIEEIEVGEVTKTDVAIAYIKGIANDKIVEEVKNRLCSIKTDGILETGYIEEFIEDAPLSPFPTILRTERPDKAAAALLEGRVAILMAGTPFVLLVPVTFTTFLTAAEDYYERYFIGTFLRLLRLVGFFIALAMPSLYVAITTFHQEMLPTPLILNIAAQREGVPFPAVVEALIMEISFELLREAGVRLPRVIGPAISIVGALVLGEAAVRAGLVSSAMVIIVSSTAIASFVNPVFSLAVGIRLLRFPMILLAASLGLFGIIIGMSSILIHLAALRSFGVPYLEPLGPVVFSDLKDAFVRAPWWAMRSRPRLVGKKELIRQARGLRPGPADPDEKEVEHEE